MSQSEQPRPQPDSDDQAQQIRPPTARVPERVADGVFSTGVIVMTGGTEFVLDFVQSLGGTPKLAARVVVPHNIMPQFIHALRQNMEIYQRHYGTPPQPPRPPEGGAGRRPTIQEIYDELKIPDDKLCGAYANGLMVGHTASEFKLDFLTNLPPHSAVSARIYLSAPQIPRMIESLGKTFEQFQQRIRQHQERAMGQGGADERPPEAAPPKST